MTIIHRGVLLALLLSVAAAVTFSGRAGEEASSQSIRSEARSLLDAGRTDAAIDVLEEALEAHRSAPDLHVALGGAYLQKLNEVGMLRKLLWSRRVRSAFAEAVSVDPNHVPGHWALMEYHLQAPAIAGGCTDEARRRAKIIAGIEPCAGHLARALIARRSGDRAGEIRHLRAALELDPDRASARERLENLTGSTE